MKVSITTVAASALAFFGVCTQAFEVPDVVPDVTFDIPINPADSNSATVSITGTIEKAVAKMEADYPGWTDIFLAQAPASNTTAQAAATPKINCNVSGDRLANTYVISQGISYVRALPGVAQNDPGKCGRVSCSYDSAIVWCNTSKNFKYLPWFAIALGAADIIPPCADKEQDNMIKGRADFDDGYSVIVRGESC